MAAQNIIKLTHPIQAHGKEISEFVIPTRLTLGALMLMDGATGEIAKIVGLIAGAFNIPPSSAEQIDAADLGQIAEALTPLLPSGGRGGKKG
jgi:hypothetical protein